MDITRLILDDHNDQRRRFAILEEIDRSDTEALEAIWDRLASFLEIHAAAEEKWFYPALLHVGVGAGDKSSAAAETRDAIRDHNDIREPIAEVRKHDVGTDGWVQAIAALNKANSDHMGEEERESLADFRRHAALQRRHELAIAFAKFEAVHNAGIHAEDKDPGCYIENHEHR